MNPEYKQKVQNELIESLKKEFSEIQEKEKRQEYLTKLNEVWARYEGEDKLISSEDIYEKLKNRPPEKKILSGIKEIDDILDGFRLNQLVVFSAPPKSGKTTFAMELTKTMQKQEPCWLPFEESAEELVQKFIDRGQKPPHFITPGQMKGNTMQWIEKKIIEAKVKFDSEVLFIDHLHFIIELSENNRFDLMVGKTMRELKGLAKKWNIIIILIAHMKKTRYSEPPELSELRDSSFIAQEADTVIMLWRKPTKEKGSKIQTMGNKVSITVHANRRTGKTGTAQFVFNDKTGEFVPQAWEWNDDDSAAAEADRAFNEM